jgi:hypothetical protein
MTSGRDERLRVAVAAAPALLGDSLRVLLEQLADVVLVPSVPEPAEVFDLALVTATSPQPEAEITIVLDDQPRTRGGGSLHHGSAAGTERLDDLRAVLAFVGDLAGSHR